MPQAVGPDIRHMPLVLQRIWRENTPPQWTVVRRMSSRTSQVVCMACRQSGKSYPYSPVEAAAVLFVDGGLSTGDREIFAED